MRRWDMGSGPREAAEWGPDCVRACQVADGMCGTEECVNPEHVHYYCTFELRDPH